MRRQPLKERSDSQSNTIRLIEETPQRLPTHQQQQRDRSLSRVQERRLQFDQALSQQSSVLPTLPSQILPPPVSGTTPLFQGSALQDRQNDVSRLARTTKQQAPTGSSASSATTHQPQPNSSTPSGQRPKTPRPSKLKTVAVRADKTFSVLELAHVDRSQYPSDWHTTPSKSAKLPATQSSHERLSSYPTENDSPTKSVTSCTQPSTSATTPITPVPVTPKQTRKSSIAEDNIVPAAPPPDKEDTEIVGGIRIVPKTPESKREDELPARTPESVPPLPLAPNSLIDEAPAPSTTSSPVLTTKASTVSAISENPSDTGNYIVYHNTPSAQSVLTTKASTVSATSENPSDTSNYVVYDRTPSSRSETSTVIRHPINPASSAPESTADSGNYQVIGEETPSASSSIFGASESHNSNYELHGGPSDEASPSSSSNALVLQPSQDSLAVAPLQPKRRRSHEKFGYYKSRSRESLRPGASLRTAPSLASISSVLTQEATRAVFASAAVVQNLPPPSSFAIPGSWAEQALSRRQHMQAHPHQWSSQLSTVLSESDGATDSRASANFSSGRRSSGFMSSASRQHRGSGGSYNSLERPQPAYFRNGQRDTTGPSRRIVGDQDEDGDHLTDMQDLRARPSRSRSGLSFFSTSSSENMRRNSIQSTSSSRANSLLASAIPTWARLYYGSGERRWLAGAPGSSTDGSVISSPPGSPPSRNGSPNTDHFPLSIYSPRRRPREGNRNPNQVSPLRRSLEIQPAPQVDSQGNLIQDDRDGPYARHSRRWRTSSVWSPHLRTDRRAARLSVWQPPSFSWSTEGSWTGRRNIQVIMFVFGFIFPFAWMIAAFLPLPENPVFVMRERSSAYNVEWSPSHPDLAGPPAQEFRPVDEARYESAKWWRRLNRCMSFVGILIIGTIVALAVVGTQDQWGKR